MNSTNEKANWVPQDPLSPEYAVYLKNQLAEKHADVMTTDEMRAKYEVLSFCAPCVVVRERATGKGGTLEFTHMPRFYFGWIADPVL